MDQFQLMLEDLELERCAEALAQPVFVEPKHKPVRKPLPDHLPRTETVLAVPDARTVCRGQLKQVDEDLTEELDFIPSCFFVNCIVRPRMAC